MLPATVGFGLELPYTGSQSQPESPENSKPSPKKIGFSPPRPIPPASMKTANPTLLKSVTG